MPLSRALPDGIKAVITRACAAAEAVYCAADARLPCPSHALTHESLSTIVISIADCAGEIDVIRLAGRIGAEGATAPETLRQTDRALSIARLWKVFGPRRAEPPKV